MTTWSRSRYGRASAVLLLIVQSPTISAAAVHNLYAWPRHSAGLEAVADEAGHWCQPSLSLRVVAGDSSPLLDRDELLRRLPDIAPILRRNCPAADAALVAVVRARDRSVVGEPVAVRKSAGWRPAGTRPSASTKPAPAAPAAVAEAGAPASTSAASHSPTVAPASPAIPAGAETGAAESTPPIMNTLDEPPTGPIHRDSSTGTLAPSSTVASIGSSAWIAIPAAEFPARASALVNQSVEIGGTYRHPGMLGPDSIGVFEDSATGKLLVQLLAPESAQDALGFFVARSECGERPCPDIYARGTVVMFNGRPALSVREASFESVVQAGAARDNLLESIAEKDRAGTRKPLLPHGGVPRPPAWNAWYERGADPATGRDASVRERLLAQSIRMRQRNAGMGALAFPGPERPEDFSTPYRGVRDTGLVDFFASFPYQGDADEFPRVAFTVLEEPRMGPLPDDLFAGASATADGCWRLRARVWVDVGHSVDIAPFNWCFSETRFNIAYSTVPLWGQRPSAIVTLSAGFTPEIRTQGPLPPYTPLPDAPDYRQTFSYLPLMIGNVLLDAGFSNWNRSDGRVWFLDEPSPEH